MRILSYFILIPLALAMSCMKRAKSVVLTDMNNVNNVIGAYTGDLPCVDCKSIHTILQLGNDRSYKLMYSYEGKSKETFVKEGDWIVNDNQLILKGIDYKYKIESDGLVQLDLSGEEITGDLADRYLLSKIK